MKIVEGDMFNSKLEYIAKTERGLENKEANEKAMQFYLKQINGIVLDVGCGAGAWARFFQPDKYIGIDASKEMIDYAKKINPEHQFFCLNLTNKLPFQDNYFDTVLCYWVLHHLPDWRKALAELNRVGRKIIITEITTPLRTILYITLCKGLRLPYTRFFVNELGKGTLIPNDTMFWGGNSQTVLEKIIQRCLLIEYKLFVVGEGNA